MAGMQDMSTLPMVINQSILQKGNLFVNIDHV